MILDNTHDIQDNDTLDAGLYSLRNLCDMDDVTFNLSFGRQTRRVRSCKPFSKAQASLAVDIHLSVVAAIEGFPMHLIIYSGDERMGYSAGKGGRAGGYCDGCQFHHQTGVD